MKGRSCLNGLDRSIHPCRTVADELRKELSDHSAVTKTLFNWDTRIIATLDDHLSSTVERWWQNKNQDSTQVKQMLQQDDFYPQHTAEQNTNETVVYQLHHVRGLWSGHHTRSANYRGSPKYADIQVNVRHTSSTFDIRYTWDNGTHISHGLDLILLQHFQYRYINEAPAPPYFVVFQLFSANKIRRCNEYIFGNMNLVRAFW